MLKENKFTSSRTKDAFAKRAVQEEKNVIQIIGYNWNHKSPQLIETLNSGKNGSTDWNPETSEIPPFCPYCTEKPYYITENQIIQLEIEFAFRSMFCYSERVTSPKSVKVYLYHYQVYTRLVGWLVRKQSVQCISRLHK